MARESLHSVMERYPLLTINGLRRLPGLKYRYARWLLAHQGRRLDEVCDWIETHLVLIKTQRVYLDVTVGQIRTKARKDIGYVCHGLFLTALIMCGFWVRPGWHNWFCNASVASLKALGLGLGSRW